MWTFKTIIRFILIGNLVFQVMFENVTEIVKREGLLIKCACGYNLGGCSLESGGQYKCSLTFVRAVIYNSEVSEELHKFFSSYLRRKLEKRKSKSSIHPSTSKQARTSTSCVNESLTVPAVVTDPVSPTVEPGLPIGTSTEALSREEGELKLISRILIF